MALVVIGRGIDLTMVTIMAISVGWVFNEINNGFSVGSAFALGFGFAVLIGIINGILIAYVEIPAIFATLGDGHFHLWLGHFALVDNDTIFVSDQLSLFKQLGAGYVGDIPGFRHLGGGDRVARVPSAAIHQDRPLPLRDGRQSARRRGLPAFRFGR